MKLSLSDDDKHTLERWVKSRAMGLKQKLRAQMILMTAAGATTTEILAELQVTHQVKGFKVSTDPRFAEKLNDVVGLYLDLPEKAIVFSVDEKSQIQALDRTQSGLPMKLVRICR